MAWQAMPREGQLSQAGSGSCGEFEKAMGLGQYLLHMTAIASRDRLM